MTAIIRREVRSERDFIGNAFKALFIVFNLAVPVEMIIYLHRALRVYWSLSDPIEQAGALLGIYLGVGMRVGIWAAGAIVLGLLTYFTRGTLTVIEERREAPTPSVAPPAGPTPP